MRSFTPTVQAAFLADNVPVLALVELDFSGGIVRVTNAGYNITFGGYTWYGLGELGEISAVQEGTELQMYGITLTLSGVPPEYISVALDNEYQGRPATIWIAPLDSNYQVLADPVIVFKGRMDTMPIAIGTDAKIQLTIESQFVDWERPRVRRYNHEDQTFAHPADKGLEFIAQMVEKEIIWGRAA
jgi:hypothetical protein